MRLFASGVIALVAAWICAHHYACFLGGAFGMTCTLKFDDWNAGAPIRNVILTLPIWMGLAGVIWLMLPPSLARYADRVLFTVGVDVPKLVAALKARWRSRG